jgi:hypothetical protein
MLHTFKGLYINEKSLDLYGRNKENTTEVRKHDSIPMWEEIKSIAELIAEKWPSTTELGEAARYIIKNYTKLTYYTKDPRISISNDFSERMLRMENLLESNAPSRTSLEGRFGLDIVRTLVQTAILAGVSVEAYSTWLLKSDEAAINANPENFTPLAYSRLLPISPQVESITSKIVTDIIDELENQIDLLP